MDIYIKLLQEHASLKRKICTTQVKNLRSTLILDLILYEFSTIIVFDGPQGLQHSKPQNFRWTKYQILVVSCGAGFESQSGYSWLCSLCSHHY